VRAADAIVGGIVYAIQREGRAYSRQRAEATARIVLASILAGPSPSAFRKPQ
jgi:hypothetical protein